MLCGLVAGAMLVGLRIFDFVAGVGCLIGACVVGRWLADILLILLFSGDCCGFGAGHWFDLFSVACRLVFNSVVAVAFMIGFCGLLFVGFGARVVCGL